MIRRVLIAFALGASALVAAEVKVAGLKLVPDAGDKEANYAKFERYAREAAAAGAQIIVTPEGYLDGYAGSTQIVPDMTARNSANSPSRSMARTCSASRHSRANCTR